MPNPTSKLNLVINGTTTQLDIHDANAVDLTNNQTVAGNKEFTGTTTAHDLVPSATDTYNLGSSSYQWNNAYIKSLTINGVVCGDILTHNVSEFVGVTGDQTIAGIKRFRDIIIRNVGNFTAGEAPTTQTSCMVLRHSNNDGTHMANTILSYMFTSGETMCELTQIPCIGSIARTWFRTNTDGSYSIYSYTKNGYLGTSSYRWKDVQTEKINGLNPGALSLPGDAYIDIDTTNYAWGSNFTFTPDYDGYCFLSIGSSGNSRLISLKTGRGEYYFSNQNNVFRFTFPVYKGILVTITTSSSGAESVIPTIRVFSCQGNV